MGLIKIIKDFIDEQSNTKQLLKLEEDIKIRRAYENEMRQYYKEQAIRTERIHIEYMKRMDEQHAERIKDIKEQTKQMREDHEQQTKQMKKDNEELKKELLDIKDKLRQLINCCVPSYDHYVESLKNILEE